MDIYYLFVQTWVPQFCLTHLCYFKNNFIIHGLWPQYYNNSYPSFCLPCDNFDKNLINETLVKKYWADSDVDWNFLKHEWDKHGCCSTFSQEEYFKNAFLLREKWDFLKVFESISIYPKHIYKKKLLTSVAEDFCGNKCSIYFQCIKSNLSEIWMTFNEKLELIKTDLESNCLDEIYF